jgi:hypothetical protein
MKNPKKTKELEWRKVGNVYLLIDRETNKSYTLDPISFMVWIQCDGKTDIETIVDIFSVDGNRDIVRAAILGITKKLENAGLITWV